MQMFFGGKPRSLSPKSKAKQAKKRKVRSKGNYVSQYSAGSKITAAKGKAAGTGSWAMAKDERHS